MRFSHILAFAIAISAAAWIYSGQDGQLFGFGETTKTPKPPAKSVAEKLKSEIAQDVTRLTAVRARNFEARTRIRTVVVRGRTEALRKVTVKAGIKGRIVQLAVQEGDQVKKGDVVAKIEIDDLKAKLAEARALVKQRKLEYDAARKLGSKGFRSSTQIAAAAAGLDGARAYVKQVQVQIAKTTVRAPFDAIVNQTLAEIGEYMEPKTPIAVLVDENPFLVVAQVSEQDIGLLKIRGTGKALLVDGTEVQGEIRFIGLIADVETRTFKVELQVDNSGMQLREGMSAELMFPIQSVHAHLLSPALLTLNDKGTMGVRAVDREGRVNFHATDIVGADSAGVWVTGLPNSVKIITVGSEFVRQGDKVRVVMEPAPSS